MLNLSVESHWEPFRVAFEPLSRFYTSILVGRKGGGRGCGVLKDKQNTQTSCQYHRMIAVGIKYYLSRAYQIWILF